MDLIVDEYFLIFFFIYKLFEWEKKLNDCILFRNISRILCYDVYYGKCISCNDVATRLEIVQIVFSIHIYYNIAWEESLINYVNFYNFEKGLQLCDELIQNLIFCNTFGVGLKIQGFDGRHLWTIPLIYIEFNLLYSKFWQNSKRFKLKLQLPLLSVMRIDLISWNENLVCITAFKSVNKMCSFTAYCIVPATISHKEKIAHFFCIIK